MAGKTSSKQKKTNQSPPPKKHSRSERFGLSVPGVYLNGSIVLGVEIIVLAALILGVVWHEGFHYSKHPEVTPVKAENLPIKISPLSIATSSSKPHGSATAMGRSVSVPILMYHYIGNNPNPSDKARYILETTPDLFDQEMNYLSRNGFTPISLDTLYAALEGKATLPVKSIVLSFDDGYVDFFVNAFPILEKYRFHATSFIPTSLMNQGYYLTWAEIKQMQASGLISFEAHSLTHPDLTAIPPGKAKQEIFESKQVLESETGAPVNFFAYPYGTSDSLVQDYVKKAGYAAAVGTWHGKKESEGDLFNWPRVRINGGITLEQFETEISS